MSDQEDLKVDRVVHKARSVLATRFGLEFLAKQYELAAKAEEEENDADYARHVAQELRSKSGSKLSGMTSALTSKRQFAIAA